MQDWLENHKLDSKSAKLISDKIAEIVAKNNIVSDKSGKSTIGEGAKQFELKPYLNDCDFLEPIVRVAEDTLHSKGLISNNERLEVCNLWTVIGARGTFHRIHRHNELGIRHYSIVLYTHVDDSDDELSGAFYAVLNTDGENDYIEFAPETGDILMFPVWMPHGTYPQTTEHRQTLNIDLKTI